MIWSSILRRSKRKTTPAPLAAIRVASPCPVSWEQMTGNGLVRHCSACNLNVYNLSAMTTQEARDLMAGREGRLCVRFFQRVDGTVLTRDCPVGFRSLVRRVSRVAGTAFSAILSIGFAAAQAVPRAGAQAGTQQGTNTATPDSAAHTEFA